MSHYFCKVFASDVYNILGPVWISVLPVFLVFFSWSLPSLGYGFLTHWSILSWYYPKGTLHRSPENLPCSSLLSSTLFHELQQLSLPRLLEARLLLRKCIRGLQASHSKRIEMEEKLHICSYSVSVYFHLVKLPDSSLINVKIWEIYIALINRY